jgi:hypothetical protein
MALQGAPLQNPDDSFEFGAIPRRYFDVTYDGILIALADPKGAHAADTLNVFRRRLIAVAMCCR